MKTKNIPVILMLAAGALTSIMTYVFHYENKTALWILTGVLIAFYILGLFVKNVLDRFYKQIAQREEEERKAIEEAENDEGSVIKKEAGTEFDKLQQGNDEIE